MKTYNLFALIAFFVAACGSTEKKADDTAEDTPAVEESAQLTEAQKQEGWKLLFDGKSLDGWRTYKNAESTHWDVADGTIHCNASENSDLQADLITVDEFENFELAFDWKISSGGNSGVMFRVSEEKDRPYFTGPEYQLLDDANYAGEVEEINFTASNYDMHAPENKKMMPVGEWNTSKIVANGPHIEHWLNGAKVLEYEIGSDDWKKRKEASKWKEMESYAKPTKGHVDLQDHGHEIWFRNIMIREL